MFEFVKNYGRFENEDENDIKIVEKKWGLNFLMNSKRFMKR